MVAHNQAHQELLAKFSATGVFARYDGVVKGGSISANKEVRISDAQLTAYLEIIGQLPIVTDPATDERALREILALARKEGLTTYDATYLELSLRLNLPLATKDAPLASTARQLGVDIIAL